MNHVTLYINKNYISICCWNNANLKAFTKIDIDNLEIKDSVIFNFYKIIYYVKLFIYDHNYQNSYLSIALDSSENVLEYIKEFESDNINLENFKQEIENINNIKWQFKNLSQANNKYYFYLIGMKQEVLFQYNLLALNCDLNLLQISTSTNAIYQAATKENLDIKNSNLNLEKIKNLETDFYTTHIGLNLYE